MAELSRDFRSMREDVAALARILRGEGDGEKGVIMRLYLMEANTRASAETLAEVKKALDARAVADTTGKWDLTKTILVTLLTAAGGLIGAIISTVLAHRTP